MNCAEINYGFASVFGDVCQVAMRIFCTFCLFNCNLWCKICRTEYATLWKSTFISGKSSTGHCKESILELHLYHLVLNWLILSHIQLSVTHPNWNLLSPTWELPKCCWNEQTVFNSSVFAAWLLHACSCIYTFVFLITAMEVNFLVLAVFI